MPKNTKIISYKESLTKPLSQTTLSFLINEKKILLAMKKRGFGKGKWNGVGGKPERKETIEETARREIKEEIGVHAKSFKKVATFNFYYPFDEKNHQTVSTFFVTDWEGEPTETEEMRPQWFPFNEIPFHAMWPDDAHWLPKVLAGKFVYADFLFDENKNIDAFLIEEKPDNNF